ncbi:VOC family protein [Corynebacterium breve]|uniref:VOC family protein n=1 Tax=Corynebacterium breve TaxID=3049799 RepID=A0ABY8VDK6_9CORY|nr:VOC family protein [Corynebacterium breve]WIM66820.1 VOC family protein [Corynebacterium breve]
MRINITSIYFDDQLKALDFYTDTLGFQVKHNVPVGDAHWITLVSPEDPEGTELLLEPTGHPASKTFNEALYADGIPFTQFAVDDIQSEFHRLQSLGVQFSMEPTSMENVTFAVFDDTCGHYIQLIQQN